MKQEEIYSLVAADLEKVQAIMDRSVSSNVRVVNHLGRYAGGNSGKKLRPMVLLLAAGLFEKATDAHCQLAAIMELIHTASLVHDDVIDAADTRRGRPSVNAAYGNEMSVLLGDWLYMTAFQLAVARRDFRILDVLMDTVKKMVEGELIQLDLLGKLDLTVDENLDVASRKTAYLFAACTQLAGIVCGRPDEEVERLRRIGLHLGLAFQLVDDVLDFTADTSLLGKPKLNDLREGKVTLPVIFLLQAGSVAHRRLAGTVLAERGFQSVAENDLLAAVEDSGALARAMSVAQDYARDARRDILEFPPSSARDALAALADYILERNK